MPLAVNGMKVCASCRLEKPVAEYTTVSKRTDGLYSYCKPCVRLKSADFKRRHPERAHEDYMRRRDERCAYTREWRKANPELVRQRDKEHYWRHRDHHIEGHRRRIYGITGEQYAALVASQKGMCAICKGPPGKKGLHIDHCHTTNVVRGLLCSECNISLGKMKDSPAQLRAAASYLEERVNGIFPKGAD